VKTEASEIAEEVKVQKPAGKAQVRKRATPTK
jgi:RNA polymerase subunit RPABC4/transcription elongation factor Spt4